MGYYNNEMYHHGVKGMKWGVRRFQNKDGSLTNAGRKRYDQDDDGAARRRSVAKKVVGLTIMGATVATAAVLYAKNPAVNKLVKSVGKTTISKLTTGKDKAIKAGKRYIKNSLNGIKEGVEEAMKEAPKKAAKTIVSGVVMNTAKRAVDKAVGKEESARIFKANNSKKIDSFWKVNERDDDD